MKRKTKRYMNAAPMAPRPSIMPSAADAGKPDSLSGLRLATSEDLMAGGSPGTLEESLYGAAGGPLLSDATGGEMRRPTLESSVAALCGLVQRMHDRQVSLEAKVAALTECISAGLAQSGKPSRRKPKRHGTRGSALLTTKYNGQLKKFGYEVLGDRQTVTFNGKPYRLTSKSVQLIVNNLIRSLCEDPSKATIRFTSEDLKHFRREAHNLFYRECIMRIRQVTDEYTRQFRHLPYARLRVKAA